MNVMGPVVGIAVVLTIVPLVLFTISSYCITGYIRDILFHGAVKCCVRSYCLNIAVSLYLHSLHLLTCVHMHALYNVNVYRMSYESFHGDYLVYALGAVTLVFEIKLHA